MNSNSATLESNQSSICALKRASICALKRASICALINGSEQEVRPTVQLNLEDLFQAVGSAK